MKMYRLIPIFVLSFCLLTISASAQEYILELHQIEATDEAQLEPKIPNDRLVEFENQGYSIMTPTELSTEFYFHIDRTQISFADLSLGGTFVEQIDMQVKTESNIQFQILNKLLSPFSTVSEQTIEPTVCDDGCTVRTAKSWVSEDAYGWGYSIDDGITYRPFSSASVGVIHPEGVSNSDTKMKMKVQTPKNQSEGNFQGVVQFIALPEL